MQRMPIALECDYCGDWPAVSRKHQSMTAYVDEESNDPGFLCEDCMEEYVEYYQDMWSEYYNMVAEGLRY